MTKATPQPPEQPGPLFWLGARALTHAGIYRRYYILGVLWIAVMLLVPKSEGSLLIGRGGDDGFAAPAVTSPGAGAVSPESATAAALAPPSTTMPSFLTAPGAFGNTVVPLAAGEPVPPPLTTPLGTITFQPPPTQADGGAGGEDPPAEEAASPLTIPPPPPLPLPPPPKELEPVLRTITPLARQGCSPVGLAGVVIALFGPSVEPVPAAQLAPYLTPLYVACGSFPQIGPRTVCEVDDVYAVDTGGLIPSPAIVGMGIDTLDQMEQLLSSLFGTPTGQAEALRQQANCRRE